MLNPEDEKDIGPWATHALMVALAAVAFLSIGYSQAQYLAVGDHGANAYSADGLAWAVSAPSGGPAGQPNLNDVDFGQGRFVAVGGSSCGTVMTSFDGLEWTTAVPCTGPALWRVDWNGAEWVAVGGNQILRSPDGISWSVVCPGTNCIQATGAPTTYFGIAHGAGRWMVVGNFGAASSVDLVTWSLESLPTVQPYLTLFDVASDGTRFVAAGSARLLVRDPAGAWVQVNAAAGQFTRVEHIPLPPGGTWVATGANGRILTSPDTLLWNSQVIGTQAHHGLASDGVHWLVVGGAYSTQTRYESSGPPAWTWSAQPLPSCPAGMELKGAAWGAGRWVAVGLFGQTLTSTDGRQWGHVRGIVADEPLTSVATDGNLWSSVGASGSLRTSADGRRWTTTDCASPRATSITWNALTKEWLAGSARSVLKSSDAVTWVRQAVPPPPSNNGQFLQGIATDGRRIAAVGDSGYWVASNDAGTTWHTGPSLGSTPTFASGINLFAVATDGDTFVAVGGPQPCCGRIYTSADLTTWTLQASNLSFPRLLDVAWKDGRFVAVAIGATLSSANGIDWTAGPPMPFSAIAGGERWAAAGGILGSSLDASTWSTAPTPNTMTAIAAVPGPMACQVTTLGPVYPGDPVTFLVTGGLPAYSWSGGDAPPPTNGGPRFTTTWPQSGMKAVQVFDLRGRQASCTADILPRPGIRCTPAHVELLTGSTQAFQASGGGGSYAWSGGDLPEGGGPEATFSSTFRTPGTYLVTVQSPGFDPATCVTLVADPLSCKPHSNTSTIGQPVRFHATGGLATKQWHAVGGNPGSGVTTGSEPFVTVFPVPGIPSVALSSGWQTAACSAIVCGGLRTEVIAKANHIWPGEVATFHALVVGGSPVHTLWEFGDGTSSEGMQATHRFNSPGRYLVQFTAWEAGSGCTATATVTVRVGIEDGSDMEPPQEPPGQGGTAILFLDAGEDQTVLEGTLVRLSARSTPGLVHSWRQVGGPDLQLLRTPEPQWTAPRLASEEPLVYSFVVEASGGGAQLFDDLHVVVLSANRPPIADAGLDVQVAPGATVSLSAGRSMDPDGDTLAFAWVEVTNDGKRLPIGNGANLTWSVPPTRQRHILEVHVSDGRRTVADGLIVDVALAASPEVAPPSHLETPAIASIPAHQAKALWLPLIPGGLAILACAGLVAGLVVAAAKRRYEESTTPGGRRMSASPRGIQDQSTIGIARGSSCAPAKPK